MGDESGVRSACGACKRTSCRPGAVGAENVSFKTSMHASSQGGRSNVALLRSYEGEVDIKACRDWV